jgi:hypothetical protein
MVISSIGITYPATFNFNNQKQFYFELGPSATGNYLVIDNFNIGSATPVLFDMTSGFYYNGEIASTPGKVKFKLPASSAATRSFMLVNHEASNANLINSLSAPRTYTNLNTASNQADYIIISNKLLYNEGGNNYV